MPVSLFGLDSELGHSAVFSPCRTWRYALQRRWGGGPFVLFIGINPSTADENVDDQTIRKCVGFAKRWGMGGLLMGNLYAYRSTDPRALADVVDPIGPDNDVWLTTMAVRSAVIIVAWGAKKFAYERANDVMDWIGGDNVMALRVNNDGSPMHPLYVKDTTIPKPWPL